MNTSKTASYDSLIREHYDRVASTDKDAATSTMADLFVREAETKFIVETIRQFVELKRGEFLLNGRCEEELVKDDGFCVLDVGCGAGFTLARLAGEFPTFDFHGIEFTDSLREIAIERFRGKSVRIEKGDIRNPETLPRKKADILICQRVVINLLEEKDQEIALKNLIDCVAPFGLLIFIECFSSGLEALNSARSEFGLEPLPPAHHNLYLKDEFFVNASIKEFNSESKELMSAHYFVSRVLHQAFLEASKTEFVRNSHFVSFFSQALPRSIGTYSPLKLLSFTKNRGRECPSAQKPSGEKALPA